MVSDSSGKDGFSDFHSGFTTTSLLDAFKTEVLTAQGIRFGQ
ncbi:hypothetical protein C942_00816 [Photobacterium marinum]|uniref:Uncharacterized protein n=1 Tax=Photobacterium marinum TaxID=1056511 RepID=L8JAC1_9GAMM|nr:hypothetical protein C942_00816 [Photobacterium marinum]